MRTFVGYAAAITLGVLCAAGAASAAPASEIHINASGSFSAKNVTVMQKNDAALYARVAWGGAFVRLTLLTTKQGTPTVLLKNNGGTASYDDIQVGDTLAVEGTLSSGADTLLINATKITDLSLNKEAKVLAGTVKSIDYAGSFVLVDKKLGSVMVTANGYTTITKGVRSIALGELAVGDKVSAVTGVYDYETKTLAATSFTVYQDPSVFKARTFEGTLKSLSGTTLPITATVTVGKSDYLMYVSDKATVTNKAKVPVALTRFTVGDKVSLYGSIRQTNLFEVDATTIRNLSF